MLNTANIPKPAASHSNRGLNSQKADPLVRLLSSEDTITTPKIPNVAGKMSIEISRP